MSQVEFASLNLGADVLDRFRDRHFDIDIDKSYKKFHLFLKCFSWWPMPLFFQSMIVTNNAHLVTVYNSIVMYDFPTSSHMPWRTSNPDLLFPGRMRAPTRHVARAFCIILSALVIGDHSDLSFSVFSGHTKWFIATTHMSS
jgi:hypothetical protein